jgi:DNA-directed RNA polymerase specialized sigma24 family protein
MATPDRHIEPCSGGEAIENVARLIEQSSLGTVGARQLRDRTDTAVVDRILTQARFSVTAEGRAWWKKNKYDAEALYRAAIGHAEGDLADQEISGRLMRLAAALGHPPACQVLEGYEAIREDQEVDAPPGGVVARSSRTSGVMTRSQGIGKTTAVADWRSFERFYRQNLDALTVTLAEETGVWIERSRRLLHEALKVAFDVWDDIAAAGDPEHWVLGYALQRQRGSEMRRCALPAIDIDRALDVDKLDWPYDRSCLVSPSVALTRSTESGWGWTLAEAVDLRITGAMAVAATRAESLASLPSPFVELIFECKRRRLPRLPAGNVDSTAFEEMVKRTCIHKFRSTARLATLLVGDAGTGQWIAVEAFQTADKACDEAVRSLDEAVAVLRRSVVNQARAALRRQELRRLRDIRRRAYHEPKRELVSTQGLGETAVVAALGRLPARQREALVLRYYGDLSDEQTADAMGVSRAAAKIHTYQGLEMIRTVLDRLGGPQEFQTGSESGADMRERQAVTRGRQDRPQLGATDLRQSVSRTATFSKIGEHMTSTTPLPDRGLVFWPVGTGDSTTIVIDDEHVVQVDLHDMAMADEDGAVVAAVVDRLVEILPQRDGMPYLAAFILTHADKDHCLGFADLLDKVTIGELWATPRLWREYTDEDLPLCADAEAFHKEAKRRVAATDKAATAGQTPASGDRIRVVGYDTDHDKHAYSELPDKYLSYPGDAVSMIDGDDVSGRFEAFIHAPFKDDCAAERNDTSLALQITLTDEEGREGHCLLLGDLAYETIKKIFEYSEQAKRPERLAWEVLLAPHHCSKKVMYVMEDGKELLKQDLLDLLERHASESAVVVVSSAEFPPSNKTGDNPPHLLARARYEEIASELTCTGEYPDADAPRPLVFVVGDDGFTIVDLEDSTTETVGKSAMVGRAAVGLGILAALAGTAIARRRAGQNEAPLRGLGQVRQAVTAARGDDAAPQQPVGFGAR